ncbi:MAG: 4'-phosphopantetheinyl transferase family protein [Thermoanaerobaculia bacterium]
MTDLPLSWRKRAIVITDVTPSADWFTEDELREADGFLRERRRDEWMAARVAAKQLALQLGLCAEPRDCAVARPQLLLRGRSPLFVSVSHSEQFAGAAIDREPVGIDVQAIREISERAAKFFLTGAEVKTMEGCAIANRLLHFWCAKEAAWKRRGGEPATLKQIPLTLLAESADGLRFDSVETLARDGAIVALTRPTS